MNKTNWYFFINDKIKVKTVKKNYCVKQYVSKNAVKK